MATPAQRATSVISALIDGTPSAATVTKWAQAFWDVFGPERDAQGQPISNPTNAQLATFYLRRIRLHHKDVMASKRGPAAADTARATELATVSTETDTELGTT